MPYLQPATANYFGFAPVHEGIGPLQANLYAVSSSETAISAGDIVTLTSRNTVRKGAVQAAVAAVVGVAAESVDANLGSTTRTNYNQILIYDHPMQRYYASDTSSGAVGSSGIGLSYFVCATGCVGSAGPSTTLKRSVMAISGAVQASSAGCVKILGLHPVENNVFATGATGTANVRKWIVQLTNNIFQTAGSSDLLTS